jgi:AcrR family transcriptional regulator
MADELLSEIDCEVLTPVVRHALGSDTAEVVEWNCRQIHGGIGGGVGGSAIYGLTGQGCDLGQALSWSLILKVLWAQADSDVSDCYYWRREADAYQSGWLDDLPGQLRAPRCFGVVDRPDGACWLWLEEVTDEAGPRWPVERYGLAARHLGQFNGAYLVESSPPSCPWLSSGWLREAVAQAAPAIELLHRSLEHPLLRRFLPGDTGKAFFDLWTERKMFLNALDRLPHTICHLDAFRRNLFARVGADGRDQTVAIDWAFVGTGAIGEEIEPLVLRSLAFGEVEPGEAHELDEAVFAGYLDGLRDAGWRGDPRQARLGYTAAAASR